MERKTMKKRYPFVIEKGDEGCSGYLPDLPGCVATGKTIEKVIERIPVSIEGHIEDMIQSGEPLPEPGSEKFEDDLDETCEVHYVEVEVAIKANAA
jgi:predicted RNase H-like HicB family nuclease